MKISKEARRVSRSLYRSCLVDGKLDESRVRLVVSKLVASRPRGALGILQNFRNLVATELERSVATVESASDLDSSTRTQLQAGLNAKYGRPLALEFKTTPELLGGIRIKVGSDVWDGSVKARLAALQVALA
ncbi:MAG: F0F1 ATP synthase subunit delta [Verrucomicrobiaceae bacterium]|nr:F0F1 ATP synthase subunit delta [Verrucomicrobiaceae bacterium]